MVRAGFFPGEVTVEGSDEKPLVCSFSKDAKSVGRQSFPVDKRSDRTTPACPIGGKACDGL